MLTLFLTESRALLLLGNEILGLLCLIILSVGEKFITLSFYFYFLIDFFLSLIDIAYVYKVSRILLVEVFFFLVALFLGGSFYLFFN